MFDYNSFFSGNGVALFGAAALPERLNVYEKLTNIISFALPLPSAVVGEVAEKGPTKTYFHHYRTCNAYIDRVSFGLALGIKNSGYDAAYVPASQSVSEDGLAGILSHKAAALLCGLGGIGKNDLLVTPRYGAAVRLGTVMTDMPVELSAPIENPCTGCGKCVSACPCGALYGKAWREGIAREEIVDAKLCSAHMKKAYQSIGRGAVCGICMAVCPVGKQAKALF